MPSIQSEKGPLRPVTLVYVLHKIGLNVRALQVFTFVLKVSHCETKCDKLKLNNVFVDYEMCLLKNEKEIYVKASWF